jgi:hypothetical protein
VSQPQTWPPAWYPDPTGRHDHRWWDGAAWTAHIADAGTAGIDPLGADMPDPIEGRPEPVPLVASTVAGVTGATDPDPAARRRADLAGTWSAAIGIAALPVAFLPMLGLAPAAGGMALALNARSRLRRLGLPPSGGSAVGLIASSLALGLALITTAVFVWLFTSSATDGFPALFRSYLDCVEVRSAGECRAELERGLAALLEP